MLTSDILLRYALQTDDASELSSTEQLALAQEVYDEIQDDRDWEWLRATATGTTSTTVSYVALPADFKKILPNKDNKSIVFVGTDYQEYVVIPMSSRHDYRNMDGFCYIDIPNQRLVFILQPTSARTIEYDYVKRAVALTPSTSPLVDTTQFNNLIAYGMARKFVNIEQQDKSGGGSYQREFEKEYDRILSDFRLVDAEIKLTI
jgi:hypothetical protein